MSERLKEAAEAIKETPYVFVYGTLMEGFGNHMYLSDSAKICNATTHEKYTMYANGVPFVVKNIPSVNISGELYKVDHEVLAYNLDTLEGHPDFYRREVVEVNGDNEKMYEAWLYFYPSENLAIGRVIPERVLSGSYHKYVLEKWEKW